MRSAALNEPVTLRACLLDLGVLSEATGVHVRVDVVDVMEVFAACIKGSQLLLTVQEEFVGN